MPLALHTCSIHCMPCSILHTLHAIGTPHKEGHHACHPCQHPLRSSPKMQHESLCLLGRLASLSGAHVTPSVTEVQHSLLICTELPHPATVLKSMCTSCLPLKCGRRWCAEKLHTSLSSYKAQAESCFLSFTLSVSVASCARLAWHKAHLWHLAVLAGQYVFPFVSCSSHTASCTGLRHWQVPLFGLGACRSAVWQCLGGRAGGTECAAVKPGSVAS